MIVEYSDTIIGINENDNSVRELIKRTTIYNVNEMRDIYYYCLKNNIYQLNNDIMPIHLQNKMRIKRSNGDINDNWKICYEKLTMMINNIIYIKVINRLNRYKHLKKIIPLIQFVRLIIMI